MTIMHRCGFPLLIIALALASITRTTSVGGLDYTSYGIPVSPEVAQSLHDKVQQAIESGALGEPISFQFNESQLTSYLTQKQAKNQNPPMTAPRVLLRDGQMQIFGRIKRSTFLANVALIMGVGLDDLGQPKIVVISADFGLFPDPPGINSAISSLISEAYIGSVGPAATGFRLENMINTDGFMTLTGRIQ
jgi:hypothetical protein